MTDKADNSVPMLESEQEPMSDTQGEDRRAPWWRRWTTWIVAVVLVAVAAIAIWSTSGSESSATSSTVAALNTVEVERTTLEEITTLDGTLGFVAGDPLVYAGSQDGIVTVAAGTGGTITSLPEEGTTVSEGEILYTVDERPVVVLYGSVPAYRTLNSRTSDGTDVLQLEEALTRLGYNEDEDMTVDSDFTSSTSDAIKELQDVLEIDDTGSLQLGSYVFVDGPVFVADVLTDLGSSVNPGAPVVATSTTPGGTVTALADEGDVLEHGGTLLSVEGDPVTLFVTDVPFYRTLSAGSVGEDVRVLEETLSAAGFNADGDLAIDGVFDDATTTAITAWQKSIGAPVDGVLNIGEVMVSEDPIRIAAAHISIGSNVSPGTQLFTPSTSTSVVSMRLPAEDQDLIVVGDSVTVVMPDGGEEPATVTSVGTVAIRSQDSGTYFDVEITLDNEGAAAGLDEAPVDVDIVDDTAANILAVPVSALLALSEGGYAVEVDTGGSTSLVGVEVGMYADGRVEVTSSDLEAGMRVVAP
ncbi:MAG: peptidoglycan-binding protein [Actinomycetota bacterium]